MHTAPADKAASLRVVTILVLLVLAMVACLELGHPYFFFQDDNRSLYFPFFVHNLRSLVGGEIPFFNFHQSLGTPTAIHYATFYPLNYLAMGLSKLLSGDWFMMMDILACIHLEIAALGFFFLMRHFRVADTSAFFGAIAWPFCSFVVTVGNSWWQIIGYAAWLPWILLFSLRQISGIRPGGFAILVMLRIMALLTGNPQFFVYTVTFDLLTVLAFYLAASYGNGKNRTLLKWLSVRVSGVKLCLAWFGSYLVVLLLTLPLVIQALRLTAHSATRKEWLSWEEYSALSYRVSHWLNGIIAPFRDMPINTWTEQQFLSHIGYLTVLFLLLALVKLKSSGRGGEMLLLLLLALFSFLWASDIGVTKLFYYLPVYNKLRFPFKLVFFTSFFLIMAATIGFDVFLAAREKAGHRGVAVVVLLIALHITNFVALYALLPQRMFTALQDKVPFDEPLKKVLTGGRIVTGWLDPVFVSEKGVPGLTVPTVGYNYATLWGLYYFGGYDPLLPEKNFQASLKRTNRGDFNVEKGKPLDIAREVPLEHFRIWGVRWYIFEKSIPLQNTGDLVRTGYGDDVRNVLYDPKALPLVYWRGDVKNGAISHSFSANAVLIEADSSSGGGLVVSVLHSPFFRAVMDGKDLEVKETEEGQMAISVPPGRHTIQLRYVDRDFLGYARASACVALLSSLWLGCALLKSRRRLRSRTDV